MFSSLYAFPPRFFLALTLPAVVSVPGCGGDSVPGPPDGTVRSVTVTPGEAAVPVGGTVDFDAVARDGDGDAVAGAEPSWSVEDGDVAEIDGEGLARGTAEGATEVVAEVEGVTGRASLTVSPAGSGRAYQLGYGTYVGGGDFEEIREPLLLPDGRLLFGARTLSSDMPTTAGVVQPSPGGGRGDSYLAVLAEDGSRLEAATYFGGSGMERPPYGIVLTSDGDVVFGSGTTSPDIPTSPDAYRASLHEPVPDPGGGYVCRISPDFTALRWCTYTGGGWPRGGLAVDDGDEVLVAGRVTGSGFSTTPGVVQRDARGTDDAFILKLRSDGSGAVFSTRLGGGGQGIGEVALSLRLGPEGDVFASGISKSTDFPVTSGAALTQAPGPRDGWLARLPADASELLYSTLYGGSDEEGIEHRHHLQDDGSILFSGTTRSPDLSMTQGSLSGSTDGFVGRLSASGGSFAFARYLGGPGDEALLGPTRDGQGRIYVAGNTSSRDLPTGPDAFQPDFGGGETDGVLFVLSPDGGTVEHLTYLGGDGDELIRGVVVGPGGEVYLAGRTTSDDFPVTEGALQTSRGGGDDGFVVKLVPR